MMALIALAVGVERESLAVVAGSVIAGLDPAIQALRLRRSRGIWCVPHNNVFLLSFRD
jgi:hypothetical protein